ncbi:hypothetical protein [Actinomadura rugatobispora]|uniref:PE-PGRS family protein n=1 Tax=Actinomadura rugatobispora TaxID=1994 RepID=A0ABW1A7U6_9ACTN|nr:hypothetical protein GCM10010200_067140 [Actinomadura rugatobispora]
MSVSQRELAWAALVIQTAVPTERLLAAWADGLASNRAAPDDVLKGLLGYTFSFLWRRLPASVVDAAVDHPEWKVRALLAEAQPGMTSEQWTRLVLSESDASRRADLALAATARGARLAPTTYEKLAADPSAQVRVEAACFPDVPAHLLTALAADPDAAVRAAACGPAWPHLDAPARQKLVNDPDGKVRAAALLRHHEVEPLSRAVFESEGLREDAVRNCRLERELAEHLAHGLDPARRRALAWNPHLHPDVLALLAEDPDASVRMEVSTRPDLTEAQRAGVRIDFDPDLHSHDLGWVVALQEDADAMRRLAASSHPLVRRSVARTRRLPPDVVERLARDDDRVVRLFLAESCDDAPADMLLEVYRWWTGSLSHPDRPRGHPNFPRRGLLRFADDPDPRMRVLALDDLDSTAELVERLGGDPEAEVRSRVAVDPRLAPASAVRLLDDPHESVRRAAARNPRLPVRVLVGLLGDAGTAEYAAGNPSLPGGVMRAMVRRLRG